MSTIVGKPLSEVQKDDVVILKCSRQGILPEVVQVEKRTPKTIWIRGIKFDLEGSECDSMPRYSILQYTQERAREIALERDQANISKLCGVNWSSVPRHKRLQILAILEAE
jgi:hypothetical protein